MKSFYWLICCGLVISAGCRKKRDAAPPPPPESPIPAAAVTAPAPAGHLANPPPAAAVAAPAAISVQHFNQLTEALLKFRRDKQRGPKDWDELIATGYLKKMPTAPAGKRYVFDRSLNVLMVPAQ